MTKNSRFAAALSIGLLLELSPGVRGASEESAVLAGEGGLLEGNWIEGKDIILCEVLVCRTKRWERVLADKQG